MKKKLFAGITILLTATLLFAGCSSKGKDESKSKDKDKTEDVAKEFPMATDNGDAIDGGTLSIAYPYDSPINGVWSTEFQQDAYDQFFYEPANQEIFLRDDDFRIIDGGIANMKLDLDKKTITIKVREDAKWSDGEKVTADDVIYPYYILADPDYDGVRYEYVSAIKGVPEYREGKSDEISGIKKIDDQTVELSYDKMEPGMAYGDKFWSSAAPYHYLKDIPVKDLEKSDEIRIKPVTLGPYKINKVKTGESVEYTPNEYYYAGKPKLDKIVMTRIPTATVVDEIKAKKYDIIKDIPSDVDYNSFKKIDGYTNLGFEELAYYYLGFKFGTFDQEKQINIDNPKSKMHNKSLRQAIAYSVDAEGIAEKFYSGLRTPANSPIPPVFGSLYDKKAKYYDYDPEKAKDLLEKAGYKDKDGDGLREDPDGNKLTINFAAIDRGSTEQSITDYMLQTWKEVGLDVKYTSGRLLELNSFYDRVQADDKDIDMYYGAWQVGTNPTPNETFSRTAAFNMMRYTSDDMDKILAAINSEKAFDDDYNKEQYTKFQELVADELPMLPLHYNYRLQAVNNRVTGYKVGYHNTNEKNPHDYFEVGVTQEKLK